MSKHEIAEMKTKTSDYPHRVVSIEKIVATVVVLIGIALAVLGIAIATLSESTRFQLYLLVLQMPGFPLADEIFGVDLTTVLGNTGSGAIIALSGILDLIGGVGLWINNKWARRLVIVIFVIAAFFIIYTIFRWSTTVLAIMPWSIPATIIDVFIICCLLYLETKH